ncbi:MULTISPECIES: hypothetical protein [Pectobacterium]|uniref:hypothetical protein n=1 Tax=Pectobacterium TaxID=122277 RepID=UPI0018DAE5F4|nr:MULTISPECIES: hypothetical protein [Pectobacterium]QPI43131.1 hypothetical protein I2D83_00295 [Pectobacterium aroidearum]
MSKEKYAIWYSISNDYEAIMDNFIIHDNECKFERDFHLKRRFIDYDHAIIIWYGKEQGELGDLSRKKNTILEEEFDFITSEVSLLLEKKNVDKISYLFALPEFEYKGKVKSNGVLSFGGHVTCERSNSSWLDEILNDM